MKKYTLRQYIFMAMCCDLGLFSKRLIAPFTNLITDALHIPGGVSTSFSIMFVIAAAVVCDKFGSATMMCAIQSGIALCLGMIGSMGLLSPIGYIVPGIVIDVIIELFKRLHIQNEIGIVIANALAPATASITANLIVFHLWGPPLWAYIMVSVTSGALCGILCGKIVNRILPVILVVNRSC